METFSLENFEVDAICGASYTAEVFLLCPRNRSRDWSLVYFKMLSAPHTIQQGSPNFLDKGPHILLWSGSQAARVKSHKFYT